MSSSVFFKFKSQKEPSRVTFDGTGISVFELKREIITMSRLGDGTDFELIIYSDDSNEEYDDDTTIIPRSTTVIAKRLPAGKAGRGGAARYVSGKMPQNAKNTHRTEVSMAKVPAQGKGTAVPNGLADTNGAQTEEDRIAAMFRQGADQWEQQQQEMANAKPIYRGGPPKGRPTNVPDRPPPPGYICYRCGEKGHWIHVCPTNDDPNFDGRPRVKRTTGIPRSFLKTVEKPSALTNDGTIDESRPSGVMVNADGEWVVAEPDKASWEQYQAKAKISAAAEEAAALGSKELQKRGFECPIDKRMFIDPTKTPCCKTTFCKDCITNALLENDLRCPECSTDDILIDSLSTDDEVVAKIREYEKEKAAVKTPKDDSKGSVSASGELPPVKKDQLTSKSPSPTTEDASAQASDSTAKSATDGNSKKRPADSELANKRVPPGPKALNGQATQKPEQSLAQVSQQSSLLSMPGLSMDSSLNYSLPFATGNLMTQQGMNQMAFPSMNGYTGMPVTMGPMMGMTPGMMNPLMMQTGAFTGASGNNWGNMLGMGYQQTNGMYGASFNQNMNGRYGQTNMQVPLSNSYMGMAGMGAPGLGMGSFANQQRTSFSVPTPNAEDSAYFRKPVNPHRHLARRNANRPTDYREI
ncbi:MAG: retinoblastoma-binding [Lasallia pustulata]|uniref:Retinoblastoma-binding n=1 Tax=Lasallia pustulata TaxID=136370 RepID=A0A5M8PUT6_9LECA|nr:MAG: retinoblastoma-binding [Lasallia pustulata]